MGSDGTGREVLECALLQSIVFLTAASRSLCLCLLRHWASLPTPHTPSAGEEPIEDRLVNDQANARILPCGLAKERRNVKAMHIL